MEITITPELFQIVIGPAVAVLLPAIHRRIKSWRASGRRAHTSVTVSVDHGSASADVVVRVSSDLNKSSRDLCS